MKTKLDSPKEIDKKCAEKVGSKTLQRINEKIKGGKITY